MPQLLRNALWFYAVDYARILFKGNKKINAKTTTNVTKHEHFIIHPPLPYLWKLKLIINKEYNLLRWNNDLCGAVVVVVDAATVLDVSVVLYFHRYRNLLDLTELKTTVCKMKIGWNRNNESLAHAHTQTHRHTHFDACSFVFYEHLLLKRFSL